MSPPSVMHTVRHKRPCQLPFLGPYKPSAGGFLILWFLDSKNWLCSKLLSKGSIDTYRTLLFKMLSALRATGYQLQTNMTVWNISSHVPFFFFFFFVQKHVMLSAGWSWCYIEQGAERAGEMTAATTRCGDHGTAWELKFLRLAEGSRCGSHGDL